MIASRTLQVPGGFLFGAVAAGIKASRLPDLGGVHAPGGAHAAALFTRNRVVGAPIHVGRLHLRSAAGRVTTLVVNSGNANCATGHAGTRACQQVCRSAADLFSARLAEIFPSSTGIIGRPLPVEKIIRALPALVASLAPGQKAVRRFAQAIMTTDTRPKLASVRVSCGSRVFTLLGIAKGSGMIHPQLATMLVYLFTDVVARPRQLQRVLRAACTESFNRISVDGDTSTNDTVLLLASGASGADLRQEAMGAAFARALNDVCRSLAAQIVADGEGVQHVVRVLVEQARSREEALSVARAIARSALVKTAWAGADPNWGRILAAVGASGTALDPRRINIFFGSQQVCRRGVALRFDEAAAHAYLSQPSYDVRVQLGRGRARVQFLTCDLTAAYVRINADYST